MTDLEHINSLIREILDGPGLKLKVDKFSMEEDLEAHVVKVHCQTHDANTGESHVVQGTGVGLVDALFQGFVALFSGEFPSLCSIRFVDFSVAAELGTGRHSAQSDMAARVTLCVANSDHREFPFSHHSPSVTASSLAVVLQAVEFFINSEKAFVALYKALQFAKEQNRPDSVAHYTTQMATLVEATSYSEVIERIKKQALT